MEKLLYTAINDHTTRYLVLDLEGNGLGFNVGYRGGSVF